MKKSEALAAAATLAAFVLLRGPDLLGPFALPFETGFQEAIALNHLERGVAANNFLPVIARVDGQTFYHTAHPPLLHIIYASLYKIAGVREPVTRCFSVLLFFLSALLWRAAAGRERAPGWAIFPLAMALPLAFPLLSATNYEPLSIFFISLLGWVGLKKDARPVFMAPALALGLLVDWPVYLALPALLPIRFRERAVRNRLLWLLAFQALFFVCLQAYQYSVAGEAAFFSHAPERANPLRFFSPAMWSELAGHIAEVAGPPAAVLCAAVLGRYIVKLVQGRRGEASAEDRADSRNGAPAGAFFVIHFALLLFFAPGLVARHYVYLLYLAPPITLALAGAVASSGAPRLALIATITLFIGRDYVLAQHRNPAYFGMADRLRNVPVRTAFATSANGAWRFYNNVETVHPVNARGADYFKKSVGQEGGGPGLVHLDLRHGEVGGYLAELKNSGRYEQVFSVPGEAVYIRKDLLDKAPAYLAPPSGSGSGFVMSGPGQDCPAGTYAALFPEYGANVSGCRLPMYGFSMPPGPGGSAAAIGADSIPERAAGPGRLSFRPAIEHVLPSAKTDGVLFLAMSRYDDKPETRLDYARFVAGPGDRSKTAAIELGAETMFVTLPGPRRDWAFDDAWWLEPLLVYEKNDGADP